MTYSPTTTSSITVRPVQNGWTRTVILWRGSPNLADDSDGNPIIADVDDCSPELIYVWDTIDPTF